MVFTSLLSRIQSYFQSNEEPLRRKVFSVTLLDSDDEEDFYHWMHQHQTREFYIRSVKTFPKIDMIVILFMDEEAIQSLEKRVWFNQFVKLKSDLHLC